MAWFDAKQLVDILTIASILSAAAFGALGLFTDFKKDGKVTRYGRMAVGGIMLSAAFSIGVGLLQDRIEADRSRQADAKERTQRQLEAGQFAAQILALQRLNSQMLGVNRANSRLISDMTRSLQAQDAIIASARQSLLDTAALSVQERLNTQRVMRTMWDDSNRIGGSRLDLVAVAICMFTNEAGRGAPPSSIFPADSFAQVLVAPRAALSSLRGRRDSFHPRPILGEGARFTALSPTVTLTRHQSGNVVGLTQMTRFGPFIVQDIGPFASPDAWREAVVEIVIAGTQPGLFDSMRSRLVLEIGDRRALGQNYDLGLVTDRMRVAVLPCHIDLLLHVGGREMPGFQARLVQVWEDENDAIGSLIIRSHVKDVDPDLFPRFPTSADTIPQARR